MIAAEREGRPLGRLRRASFVFRRISACGESLGQGISLSEALSMFSSGIVSAVTAVFASLFSRTHGSVSQTGTAGAFLYEGVARYEM